MASLLGNQSQLKKRNYNMTVVKSNETTDSKNFLSRSVDSFGFNSSEIVDRSVKVDETFEKKEPYLNLFKRVKVKIIYPLPG